MRNLIFATFALAICVSFIGFIPANYIALAYLILLPITLYCCFAPEKDDFNLDDEVEFRKIRPQKIVLTHTNPMDGDESVNEWRWAVKRKVLKFISSRYQVTFEPPIEELFPNQINEIVGEQKQLELKTVSLENKNIRKSKIRQALQNIQKVKRF